MADPVTAALVAGTAITAGGTLMQGQAAKEAAAFESAQMERNAQIEAAASQRQAIEDRRQAELQMSRARAVAAASGGTATDIGVTEIMSRIDREGEFNALTSLYSGKESAIGLQQQAAGARFQGKAASKASKIQAVGTVLSGGAKAFG